MKKLISFTLGAVLLHLPGTAFAESLLCKEILPSKSEQRTDFIFPVRRSETLVETFLVLESHVFDGDDLIRSKSEEPLLVVESTKPKNGFQQWQMENGDVVVYRATASHWLTGDVTHTRHSAGSVKIFRNCNFDPTEVGFTVKN